MGRGETPKTPRWRSFGLLCVSPRWEVTKDGATCPVREVIDQGLTGLSCWFETKLLLNLGVIPCLSFPTEREGQSIYFLWESYHSSGKFFPILNSKSFAPSRGCSAGRRAAPDGYDALQMLAKMKLPLWQWKKEPRGEAKLVVGEFCPAGDAGQSPRPKSIFIEVMSGEFLRDEAEPRPCPDD